MSRPDIPAIRARVAAATPGPWTFDGYYIEGPNGEYICEVIHAGGGDPDTDLIANAPSDLTNLCDEVDGLRAEVQHYHDKAKGCEREMNRLRDLLTAHGLPLTPIGWRPPVERSIMRAALEANEDGCPS